MSIRYLREAAEKSEFEFGFRLRPEGIQITLYGGIYEHHRIVAWDEIEMCKVNPLLLAMEWLQRKRDAYDASSSGRGATSFTPIVTYGDG